MKKINAFLIIGMVLTSLLILSSFIENAGAIGQHEANDGTTFGVFPFDLLDIQHDGGSYFGVWGDGTYIYTACSSFGIYAYTFNENNTEDFWLKAKHDNGGYYEDIWSDGNYIYVASNNGGIHAYSFDGTSFTLNATQYDGGTYLGVWCDGNYIYTTCNLDGVRAYTFDGTAFTLLATQDDGGYYSGVYGDGTYIYTTCDGGNTRAYTFDGSSFTLRGSIASSNWRGIWCGGGYIYVTKINYGVFVYTFDGSSFTLKDSDNPFDTPYYHDVWSDGAYIYLSSHEDGIGVYSFNENSTEELLLKDTRNDGYYRGVWGDGTYIYTACSGVCAYSPFESFSVTRDISQITEVNNVTHTILVNHFGSDGCAFKIPVSTDVKGIVDVTNNTGNVQATEVDTFDELVNNTFWYDSTNQFVYIQTINLTISTTVDWIITATHVAQPEVPTSFTSTAHTKNTVSLSWTRGTGAGTTVIRYSTTGYPATPTSGSFAYNGTGASTTVSGLGNGQIHYFRAWSYTSGAVPQFSDDSASVTEYTNPGDPSGLNAYGPTYNSINLTWSKGTGADTTIIRGKIDSYPSTYSSDVAVYSGTGTSTVHSVSPEEHWFYRAWAYDTESGYYSEGYSEDDETSLPGNPSVTTGSTTGITDVNATLYGNLVDLGNAGSVTVYFQYGETESFGSISSSLVRGATGSFSINIVSLSADTLYYYRAVADGDGIDYGATDSFTTGTIPPTVTTNTAINVDIDSATLRGTLDNMGTASSIQALFEYGETEAYGYETSSVTLTATGTFSRGISSLDDDTLYHFRAKTIGDGTTYGSDQTFTTTRIEIAPSVITGASTDIAVTSVTLNANLLSLGSADPISVYFQYGVTPSFESTTSSQSFSSPTPFSSPVAGLSGDTVYYYRAVADGDGTSYGSTNSFTTGTTPPTITTGVVTNILQRGVTLHGTLNNMGTASSVQVSFEYGETGAYGDTSSSLILSSAGDFSIDISGLSTGTLYHFRAKAGEGTTYGSDGEFTTLRSGGNGGGGGGGVTPPSTKATLTVYVADQYGRPLQNAFVIIFQSTGTTSLGISTANDLGTTVAYDYTNAEGIATFELDKGTYIVQIERQGYSTETRTVSLLADMSMSDIELNPTSVSVFGISSWMIMLLIGIILLIVSLIFRKNLNISGWSKPKNMFGASKPGSWTFIEKSTRGVLFGLAGILLVVLIIFIIPNVPALEPMAIYYVLLGVLSLFCIVIESINPKFGIACLGFGKSGAVAGNIFLGLAFASIFIGLTGFISQFQLLDIPLISAESLIMILMVAGVASFFEEIFFAGVLTPTIAEKLGIVSSIILVSIIFMFGHGLTYGWALIPLFNALIFRAGATVLVLHRKSWLSPLVAHTFINFLSILAFTMV